MESKQILKKIAINGTPAEKKELFGFDSNTDEQTIY